MKGEKMDFTQYVHEFEREGKTRYAVGQWDDKHAQYWRPFDYNEGELTGCSGEFARQASAMQSYPTRRQALRRARYLFYEMHVMPEDRY
jgi:hypothetical protein